VALRRWYRSGLACPRYRIPPPRWDRRPKTLRRLCDQPNNRFCLFFRRGYAGKRKIGKDRIVQCFRKCEGEVGDRKESQIWSVGRRWWSGAGQGRSGWRSDTGEGAATIRGQPLNGSTIPESPDSAVMLSGFVSHRRVEFREWLDLLGEKRRSTPFSGEKPFVEALSSQ